MVKELYLCTSTDELNDKAEDVYIDPKTDKNSLSRYVKSAELVFKSAETKRSSGDEELAYVYYMKYMHVRMQLMSTVVFKNNKAFENELNKNLPLTMYEKAIQGAEKLKHSLNKRYKKRAAAQEKLKEREREEERVKIEAQLRVEKLRIQEEEAAKEELMVDAAHLFQINNAADLSPLVPLGQTKKDLIPKEPHLSPIELMHILESKMTVLLVDIRSLDEFKQSHVIHQSMIFVSRDYLDINTKLTAAEVRELILFKTQRLLWDKRNSFDLIVIFDSASHIDTVLEEQSHPINIIRDCTTDCLDPHFMTADLPKVLDGGYENWVYHFPKHCTNPDRVKYLRKNVSKTTISKSVLPTTKDAHQAPPIYPDLNPSISPLTVPEPTPTPASVTCGNVQINMSQTPQTIQINQWSQPMSQALGQVDEPVNPYRQSKEHPDHSSGSSIHSLGPAPALFAPSDVTFAYQKPTSPNTLEKRGGLKITDIYHTPITPQTTSNDTVTSHLSDIEQYYQSIKPQQIPISQAFTSSIAHGSQTSTYAVPPLTYPAQPNTTAQSKEERYTSFDEIPPPAQYSDCTVLDMGGTAFDGGTDTSFSQPSRKSLPVTNSHQPRPQQQVIRRNSGTTFPVLPQPPSAPASRPIVSQAPPQSSRPLIAQPSQPLIAQPLVAQPLIVQPSQPLVSQPLPQPSRPLVPQPSNPSQSVLPTPPAPPAPKESIYAELEPRRKLPTVGPPPDARNQTIYADIKSVKPSIDRTVKPTEKVVEPVKRNVAPQNSRPNSTVPKPEAPSPNQSVAPALSRSPNPSVNRTIKPLTAREVEEKYLRMMPAHGAVQQGTCGLKNIGNTCFMNAVLQCLVATGPLTHYFLTGKYKQEINNDNPLGTHGLVAEEFAFLVKVMWADTYRHLAPKDWKSAIGRFRPQFLDYSQKDCQEFTVFMLDALHEDLNRVTTRPPHEELDTTNMPYKEASNKSWAMYVKGNNSIIVDLFQGQYRSIIACMTCGNESVTFEPFMYLSVPVSNSRSTLKECIDAFCTVEQVSGDDKWLCTRCKKYREATKSITIWKLPSILVIHLKRFSYSGMWRDKISSYVDFPVKDFRISHGTAMANPEEGKKYRLFGVTNHTGTLEGGHYIGCSRNPASGDWFTYDDHVIRPMTANQTKKKDAYLLFYTSFTEDNDVRWIRESVLKRKP